MHFAADSLRAAALRVIVLLSTEAGKTRAWLSANLVQY
jgi:hypothetical protein